MNDDDEIMFIIHRYKMITRKCTNLNNNIIKYNNHKIRIKTNDTKSK